MMSSSIYAQYTLVNGNEPPISGSVNLLWSFKKETSKPKYHWWKWQQCTTSLHLHLPITSFSSALSWRRFFTCLSLRKHLFCGIAAVSPLSLSFLSWYRPLHSIKLISSMINSVKIQPTETMMHNICCIIFVERESQENEEIQMVTKTSSSQNYHASLCFLLTYINFN